ncbi:MAG: hypothetical protein J6J42_11045 [Lachnospiraceae bacterium]|nr:hypothetical protein [Lachnospiraceae bacterium]
MLVMMKRREQRRKPVISLTGTLARALRPGMPAVYLYQGFLIRTSAVEAILEADPNHVRFETKNSIYSISYFDPEGLDEGLSA